MTAGDDMTIRIWDLDTGTQIQVLKEHTNMVVSLAFNQDGSLFASGDEHGYVILWKVTFLQEELNTPK